MKNIVIARVDGKVRVYAEDGAQIGDVMVDGNDNVIIEGENSIIIFSTNSIIKTAIINGENAEIRVLKGSKIEDIVINSNRANYRCRCEKFRRWHIDINGLFD